MADAQQTHFYLTDRWISEADVSSRISCCSLLSHHLSAMQLLSCLHSLPSSFLKLNYKEMLHPGAIAATYIPHMMGWNHVQTVAEHTRW